MHETPPSGPRRHELQARNGDPVEIIQAADGRFACPICSHLAAMPAYEPGTGRPSFAWCESCEFQWGWDDIIPPDAPPGSQQARWRELREQWLASGSARDQGESRPDGQA